MSVRPQKLSFWLSILAYSIVLSPLLYISAMAQTQHVLDNTQTNVNLTKAEAKAKEKAGTAVANKKVLLTLGNIIVTAPQSRTQKAQSVPIAMQIVTQKQINTLAATNLSQLNNLTPGVNVGGAQVTQPSYSIRGIGMSDFGIGTGSPIGIFEDGVPVGKTGGVLLIFNDVKRVVVLKGPQGTLFGINSAAGAISVVTNAPENDWEELMHVRMGNYGSRYVDGVLNAPITDNMAYRLSFVDNQSDGWLHDAVTGQRFKKNGNWGMRNQLRWKIPGDTVVRVVWEHEQLNQPARPALGLVSVPSPPGRLSFPPNPQTYLNPITAPINDIFKHSKEKRRFDGMTLFVSHPFSFGKLNTITAYQHFSTSNIEDAAGTDQPYLYFTDGNIQQNTSWFQEFKLSGKNNLINWVAGASYYYVNARQDSQINLLTNSIDTILNNTQIAPGGLYGPLGAALGSPGLLLNDPWQENMFNHGHNKAYAIYGDLIWHLSNRLDFTTGLRFTRNEKQFSWYNPERIAPQLDATLANLQAAGIFNLPGVPPIQTFQKNLEYNSPAATNTPLRINRSWNNLSPRIVLNYKWTPNVMFYGSVTKGYEAGGFNTQLVDSVYQPEEVLNYEFGIKSYFPGYRLLFNASAYYYRYSNLQSLRLIANANSSLPAYEVTTSDQHAKGLDLEVHWLATKALRLNLTASYIDATYLHYVDPAGKSLSGQPVGVPLWSAVVGMEYVWHDVLNGDLRLNLLQTYGGKTRCNIDSTEQGQCLTTPTFTIGAASHLTDLHLGWSSPHSPWSLALYVNNVFNKQYVSINNISASILGTPFADLTPPRIWGVELGMDF